VTTFAAAAGYLYPSAAADDSRYQLGELEVLLLETDPKERQRLKEEIQPTLARLAKQVEQPQRLAVSQSSDYYALHCIHGSHSYTLSSHRQQLEQISDSALQRCLQ
jgi:DNA-binding IclR family transcriptional regulator